MPRSLYDHNDGDKVRKPKADRDPDARGLLHLYLEWPNGYPGPVPPLSKKWETDGKYRRHVIALMLKGAWRYQQPRTFEDIIRDQQDRLIQVKKGAQKRVRTKQAHKRNQASRLRGR